jgi:hypothetical protein
VVSWRRRATARRRSVTSVVRTRFSGAAALMARAGARPEPAPDGRASLLALPAPPRDALEAPGVVGGALRALWRREASGLEVSLPATAQGPLTIAPSRGGAAIRASRIGASAAPLDVDGSFAVYRGAAPGVDAVLFAIDDAVEELLVVEQQGAPLGYEIELPEAWTLATAGAHEAVVADGAGRLALRITASRALRHFLSHRTLASGAGRGASRRNGSVERDERRVDAAADGAARARLAGAGGERSPERGGPDDALARARRLALLAGRRVCDGLVRGRRLLRRALRGKLRGVLRSAHAAGCGRRVRPGARR